MCGIAGIIHTHNGKDSSIGHEMALMLQAMHHRGPDSAGFALYGAARPEGRYVMRVKVAEQGDAAKGVDARRQIEERKKEVAARLKQAGAKIKSQEDATDYALRIEFSGDMALKDLMDYVEDCDQVEILSLGSSLELVKDLGDANGIAGRYQLDGFHGTHAIGHTRMATESDVDIRSAHPFWAYPYSDVSVVHNGQLTNYWSMRRAFERKGHRFMTECDSELIAVYIAAALEDKVPLEDAMRQSTDELDGVFTYLVATRDALGMAKDTMAAKPMVLYEDERLVAMASEEVSIRSIFPHEIPTRDPYEGEVRVWHR